MATRSLIGLFQAFAVIPGVSRSRRRSSAGRALGVSKRRDRQFPSCACRSSRRHRSLQGSAASCKSDGLSPTLIVGVLASAISSGRRSRSCRSSATSRSYGFFAVFGWYRIGARSCLPLPSAADRLRYRRVRARTTACAPASSPRGLELPRAVVFDTVSLDARRRARARAEGAPAGTLVARRRADRGAGTSGSRVARPTRGAGVWLTLIERPTDARALDVLSLRMRPRVAAARSTRWPRRRSG